VLDVQLTEMTMQDSPGLRIIRGILSAGIILLVVDVAWNIVKVLIDGKLSMSTVDPENGGEAAHRQARLRTLLPILRNFLMILFAAIAIMMALSSVGIEIGPLIAGAGIVGVAIGFGAQSVVKDIISGMFYLLDDAFRIGEYIQSGSYRGTVESFSLRSIRLRHHRGPIFIVPFSELGAVQNMSRDWSIVKFMLSVAYDADIDRVKKVTKAVGKALKEDPEFNPFIIENLKMKGIDEISDQGTKLSFGMTLKPTQLQSAIRRRAYAMLRQAFNENNIDIAVPTVKVSGGKDDDHAAAARHAIANHNAAMTPGAA
jgi:small-conductance mechanosensitive channel